MRRSGRILGGQEFLDSSWKLIAIIRCLERDPSALNATEGYFWEQHRHLAGSIFVRPRPQEPVNTMASAGSGSKKSASMRRDQIRPGLCSSERSAVTCQKLPPEISLLYRFTFKDLARG